MIKKWSVSNTGVLTCSLSLFKSVLPCTEHGHGRHLGQRWRKTKDKSGQTLARAYAVEQTAAPPPPPSSPPPLQQRGCVQLPSFMSRGGSDHRGHISRENQPRLSSGRLWGLSGGTGAPVGWDNFHFVESEEVDRTLGTARTKFCMLNSCPSWLIEVAQFGLM